MDDNYDISKSASKADELYHKGQRIVYKGEAAYVIEVNPVFTIKIDGKCRVVCGDILDEVRSPSN